MLGFFAAMRAADNDENPAGMVMKVDAGHFRPDILDEVPGGDLNRSLLDNPGQRDGRFVVIPNVLSNLCADQALTRSIYGYYKPSRRL
jgi:hypothetical protein